MPDGDQPASTPDEFDEFLRAARQGRPGSVAASIDWLLGMDPTATQAHHVMAALDDLARSAATDIDPEMLRALLTYALTYMLDVGADSGFDRGGMGKEFVQLIDQLIEVLQRKGESVTTLLLTLARFHSQRSNVGDARLRTLRRALSWAVAPAERVDAMLGMAQFENDRSSFPAARRWLAQCEALASTDASIARLYRSVFLSRQGLSYFSSNADRSRRLFEQAIEAGSNDLAVPQVKHAVAEANHYVGRLLAQAGDLNGAAAAYMVGRRLSGSGLSGSAYFHMRLAELLLSAGDLDHARFHLDQSDKAFGLTRNDSDGRALLAGAWAHFFLKAGDIDSAEEMIGKGLVQARRDGLWRPQLILLQQLVFQRLARGWRIGAAGALFRALTLFFLHAPRDIRNFPASIRQAFILGIQSIRARGNRVQTDRDVSLDCPCGEHL